jgi:hypothetical protein
MPSDEDDDFLPSAEECALLSHCPVVVLIQSRNGGPQSQ